MELEIPEPGSDDDGDGWTIIVASGEVDVAAAPELRDTLTALVADGHTRLLLDLEDVDFIDSTGLGVIVGAVRRARAADGDLRVVCTNTRILRVFAITGLDKIFVVAADRDQATDAPVPQA